MKLYQSSQKYKFNREQAKALESIVSKKVKLKGKESEIPIILIIDNKTKHIGLLEFGKEDLNFMKSYLQKYNYTIVISKSMFNSWINKTINISTSVSDFGDKIYYKIQELLVEYKQYEEFEGVLKNKKEENLKKKLAELKLKFENKEYKGIKERVALRKDIERIEYTLQGKDYDKEMLKLEEERKIRIKEESKKEEEQESNLKKLIELEEIKIPKECERYFNRPTSKNYKKYSITVYRGTLAENKGKNRNSGTAYYGSGLYTTTNKSYAKKFGDVSIIDNSLLPSVPIMFKDQTYFEQFVYEFCQATNISKREIFSKITIEDFFYRLGFDGATIGSGKDMIIVTYPKK